MAGFLLPALYCLNIALFFGAFVFVPVYLTRYFKLGWLNLLTIPTFSSLPLTFVTSFSGPYFFLEDSWFNPYFQYALLVNNLHEILIGLTLIAAVRFFHHSPAIQHWIERFSRAGGQARPQRMRRASLVFLGLFAISFVLLAQHSFSVLQWLADPRTGYQYHRTGAGQWYAFAISFLAASLVLATTYARSPHMILALTPVYLYLTYLLGSKALVISVALYIVIILSIRRYRYFNQVAAVVLGGAALLTASIFAGGAGIDVERISGYSDYFVNAAHYYQSYLNDTLPLYHGEVFFSSFWQIVPRSLYPDKPYVYGLLKVVDVFYPGATEKTNMPAFATVAYFADFGWIGVIVSGIFNIGTFFTALLYAIVLPRLQTFRLREGVSHARLLDYPYLLVVGPSFLLFFEFPTNLLVMAIVAGVIEVSNRLRLTKELGGAAVKA